MAASEAIPDVTGTVLNGEYELLSPLPGETRAVYEAERRSDGQKVAVRLLRGLGPAAATVASERARRALTVRHPALASVLTHGTSEDGTLFVVSEFIDGTPLSEWADAVGIPPLHKVVDFVHQLCQALQVARRHGLTHEFISPRNILVLPSTQGPSGKVAGKLLDLGITAGSRQVAPPVESALFMAPEQLSELQLGTATGKQTSPAANVYSAGALLYHLCTGGPPFRAGSLRALASAQAEQPLVRPSRINPAIPAPLDEIILRALSIDPSNRYPSVAELGEALAFIVARTQSVAPGSLHPAPPPASPDEPDTDQVPIPRFSHRPEGPSRMDPMAPLPVMDSRRTARQRPLSDSGASQVLRSPTARPSDRATNRPPSQAPRGLFSSGPPPPESETPSGYENIRDTLPPPPEATSAAPPSDAHKTLSTPPPKYGPDRPGAYRASGMEDSVPPVAGQGAPSRRARSAGPTGTLTGHGPVRRPRSSAPPVPPASARPIPPPLGQAPTPQHGIPSAQQAASPGAKASPPTPPPEPETVIGETMDDAGPTRAPTTGSALERIKLDVIMAEMDDEVGNEEPTAPPGTFDPPLDPAAYAPYIPMPEQQAPSLLQRVQMGVLALLLLGALGGAYWLLRGDGPQAAGAPAAEAPTATATAEAPAAASEQTAPSTAQEQEQASGPDLGGPGTPTEPSAGERSDEPASEPSALATRKPARARRPVARRANAHRGARSAPQSTSVAETSPRIQAPPREAPLPTAKAPSNASSATQSPELQQAAKAAPPMLPATPTAEPRATAQEPTTPAAAPKAPAAPPAPLKARTSVVDLEVRGSLATSVVKRAVDRARDDFATCYEKAAKAAGKNSFGSIAVEFDVDFRGRTRNVSASGGGLPGLATCVRKAANTIATNRAPDTGTVHASFKVRYAP